MTPFSVSLLRLDYQNSRFIYNASKHILIKHFVNDRMIANNDAKRYRFFTAASTSSIIYVL